MHGGRVRQHAWRVRGWLSPVSGAGAVNNTIAIGKLAVHIDIGSRFVTGVNAEGC